MKRPQWVVFNSAKVPCSPFTGQPCDAQNPANWVDRVTAEQAVISGKGTGTGYVFNNNGLFFLDVDHALQPDGTWSPLATQLCQVFAGSYIEVSISGTGLHIIGTGVVPDGIRSRNQAAGLELYVTGRYATISGFHAVGDSSYNAQPQLDWLVANYFPANTSAATPADWSTTPDPEYTGPTDDDELIRRMLNSKSTAGAFTGRASVNDLWTGNVPALAAAYPSGSEASQQQYGYDHSVADAALCQHLAFWTGCDCERIDRLFRLSGLMRDKWDRVGYMQSTVLGAVSRCQSVYSHTKELPSVAVTEPVLDADPVTGLREGFQTMEVTAQIAHFKGCAYVCSASRIFTPGGLMLTPDRFNVLYGGYSFSIDNIGDKISSKAWEAFTESRGYHFPKADDMCFRPELSSGTIVTEEGQTLVNTYVPIDTPRIRGDASPFTRHVAKMLPDERDQRILLSYMAAVLKYPGVKFQWWPLIQGCEGNGKSMLIRVLSFCVGQRYSHTPSAKELGNKFNAWILRRLFAGIQEVYTADRQDLVDTLKPLITDDRLEVQPKGVDQTTGDNRVNGMLNSNHKEAIRKTRGDRRYCIFYTAQQEPEDMRRDGMTGDYFPDLYNWLKADGYAIVNDYLREYQIPDDLNPATHCQTAPVTTSTAEAISASLGGIEQEVMDAIDEGRPGFAGGWISSVAFEQLLTNGGKRGQIPPNKRRALLRDLGYDWHPALASGRLNNPINDCGKLTRPRLFIRRGSAAEQLQSAADVLKAYVTAQSGGSAAGWLTAGG